MLATLHDHAFDGTDWIFEIKWDGYRAIAEVDGHNIKLYSRSGLSFAAKFELVYQSLQSIRSKVVLDGEIVALDENGKPDFQLLQQYERNQEVQLVYYIFDLLYLDGKSLERQPLLERKALLRSLIPENAVIRYCDHIAAEGKRFFKQASAKGLEGIIAKRTDSTYVEGKRSKDWLKIKHVLTDEAIIAGYTAPRRSRKYFGALILADYQKGKLNYIGHTGTGFDQATLRDVYEKMQPLKTTVNPFGKKVKVNAPVTWVKPELVCNLKYTEVTEGGNRRHPVFMGLREDKKPEEVHAEAPVATTAHGAPLQKTQIDMNIPRTKAALSHLDKLYWPEEGYTKGDVINYYNTVYKYIIPHIKGRPQSLKRTPNGITGQAFFHKDAGENAPEWMDTFPVFSESAHKTIDYLVCNNKDMLLYIANLGCIEINPWNSTTGHPDRPDYLVMDLDPSEKNTFDEVIDCALVIKDILDEAGIAGYCKTSGATGMHVYVPLNARYTYEETRAFAELIARLAQERLPASTTLERSLSKRKKNKIYIDYLQNKEGATLSCAYSLRPKPGAPVSTPLEWKEVKHGLDPLMFHMLNTPQRLEKKGDLFLPVLKKGADISKALKKLDV